MIIKIKDISTIARVFECTVIIKSRLSQIFEGLLHGSQRFMGLSVVADFSTKVPIELLR